MKYLVISALLAVLATPAFAQVDGWLYTQQLNQQAQQQAQQQIQQEQLDRLNQQQRRLQDDLQNQQMDRDLQDQLNRRRMRRN